MCKKITLCAQTGGGNLLELAIAAARNRATLGEISPVVEIDLHVLGISSVAAGHKTLVPQVIEELKKYGRQDIMAVVGGVIPYKDYQYLFDVGAVVVFGPGTKISEAAIKILEIIIAE